MAFNSNDLYTSGEYYKKNPTWDDEDAAWKAGVINNLLLKNNLAPKTVTEIGCGAGGILAALANLNNHIESLKGYDIAPEAINLAQKKATQKISFYTEDFANVIQHAQADLLLCIDVIEHIDDYYGFLQKLQGTATYTIFHIPLDLSCRTILKPHVMLEQRNLVGHLHYFTKDIAEWALNDTGFTIVDWCYTKPTIDTHPQKSIKQKIKKLLRNISFFINKNVSVKIWGGYSIMVLVKNKAQ